MFCNNQVLCLNVISFFVFKKYVKYRSCLNFVVSYLIMSYSTFFSYSKYFVFFVFYLLNVVKLPFRVKFLFVTDVVSYMCYFISISYLTYYVFFS